MEKEIVLTTADLEKPFPDSTETISSTKYLDVSGGSVMIKVESESRDALKGLDLLINYKTIRLDDISEEGLEISWIRDIAGARLSGPLEAPESGPVKVMITRTQ
jgi:hypothetical protein